MSIRYSISILTYTQLDRVKQCIRSVMANSPAGQFELILTANGPIAAEYFRSIASPTIIVIENQTNEGFILPSIRALEKATGEFFVALNDDATVPPGWLEKLRHPFDSDPMMGLTGPEGGCCVWDAQIQGRPGRIPEYIEFACAMGRSEVLRQFGLFDQELSFAYFEDCELALRMREAGYKMKIVPFRILHHRAATSRDMPEIRKYQTSNGGYFRRRHAGYLKARRFDYVTVIKRHAAHGDVLLTTPIIRALQERNPASPIWVETLCDEVLKNNPRIQRIGRNIMAPRDAWIIDLNMAYENSPMTHIVAAYAMKACVRDYSCRPEIYPTDADAQFAACVDREWIAVHPGPTTWGGKNWPMARWYELLSRMDGPVVLVGSNGAAPLPCAKDLRGRTTIGQLAAVIRNCRLMVTVDSLPLHIAQAVGTPVVALFGVTSPEFILTDGSPAIGVCSDRTNQGTGIRHRIAGATFVKDHYDCMNTITVEMVMHAVGKLTAAPVAVAQP